MYPDPFSLNDNSKATLLTLSGTLIEIDPEASSAAPSPSNKNIIP